MIIIYILFFSLSIYSAEFENIKSLRIDSSNSFVSFEFDKEKLSIYSKECIGTIESKTYFLNLGSRQQIPLPIVILKQFDGLVIFGGLSRNSKMKFINASQKYIIDKSRYMKETFSIDLRHDFVFIADDVNGLKATLNVGGANSIIMFFDSCSTVRSYVEIYNNLVSPCQAILRRFPLTKCMDDLEFIERIIMIFNQQRGVIIHYELDRKERLLQNYRVKVINGYPLSPREIYLLDDYCRAS